MSGVRLAFEADLVPHSHAPRIRFNFSNGWSASLVLQGARPNRCDYTLASIAACPTGQWGTGKAEIVATECYSDEAVAMIADILMRPAIDTAIEGETVARRSS